MHLQQSTISCSQNIRSKLSIKESLSPNNQIHSQPQSSKGADIKKYENYNSCNSMKKKLSHILNKQNEQNKIFKVSPTHSQKQQYFISTSQLQSKPKNCLQKQNHTTENFDKQQSFKGNSIKLLKPTKTKDVQQDYQEFIEQSNQDIQKQLNNLVKSVDKIQPEQFTFQNTERSSLIALFERLNNKEQKLYKNKRQAASEVFQIKKSPEIVIRQKLIGGQSNNSSGQLINANSTTTQIYQNQGISIEQKLKHDDPLLLIVDKTKILLQSYRNKLQQSIFEKELLNNEITFWKNKFLELKQQQS